MLNSLPTVSIAKAKTISISLTCPHTNVASSRDKFRLFVCVLKQNNVTNIYINIHIVDKLNEQESVQSMIESVGFWMEKEYSKESAQAHVDTLSSYSEVWYNQLFFHLVWKDSTLHEGTKSWI